MILQILKTFFISVGIGFLVEILQSFLDTNYLTTFLSKNLITILISLLAINSATTGIILTKIRDLVDKYGNAHFFSSTRKQMVLAVKEQICLIGLSIILLIFSDSQWLSTYKNITLLTNTIIISIFIYALFILYDTAKGVLLIIDFDDKKND